MAGRACAVERSRRVGAQDRPCAGARLRTLSTADGRDARGRDEDGAGGEGPRTRRRDALARRSALIEAARACFARSGYFVPLEEVADAAGVGRGTFYRNFKDRMALALAVMEREVDRLGRLVDVDLPLDRALARIVIEGAYATRLFARLAIDMPLDGEDRAAFDGLRERLERLLEPLAARAHREGTLAEGLGAHELMLAMRMLGAIIMPAPATRRDALLDEALALVTVGLRPR